MIYSVDYRTYSKVFGNKEKSIMAIEKLLLVEHSSSDFDDNAKDIAIDTNSNIKLEDNNKNNNNKNNNKISNEVSNNSLKNSFNKNSNKLYIISDENTENHNILGMLQVVIGKKGSLIKDSILTILKVGIVDGLKFSFIYFLDHLVLADTNDDVLYIAEIAVDESQRGKGIGTKILKQIIKTAKEKGFKRIVLDADFRNEGAFKLYESIGFKKFNQKNLKFLGRQRGMYNMEYIL